MTKSEILVPLLLASACAERPAPQAVIDGGAPCGFTARFGLSAVSAGGVVFAIGGTQVVPAAVVESAASVGRWLAAAPLPSPVTWGGAAAVPGGLLLVGGDGEGLGDGSSSVERFDLGTGGWSAGPALPMPRWALAVASGGDGTAYAVGGLSGPSYSCLPDAERLAPGGGAWSSLPPLPTARAFLAAAVGGDGRLYAVGGCGSGCSSVLAKAERYDPLGGGWSPLPPMPTARAHLAAAAGPDGRVYVLGGIDPSGNPLAAAEVFDPNTGVWSSLPPLPAPRSDLAAAFDSDGGLLALGGESGDFEPLGAIDRYDATAGAWQPVGCEALDAGSPAPATFAQLQTELFEAHGCTKSGCHDSYAAGGLDLATDPYVALLGPDGGGMPAENLQGGVRGLSRVAPGDPAHSLLWLKLSMHAVGDYATYGQAMPAGAPDSTPPEQRGRLEAWIEAGAPGP